MRFPGVVALYCWGGGAAWTASSEKADGSPVTKVNLFYNGYTFEECLYDYRLSMLEILVFWIITGGYCNYQGERAAAYLRNTMERLDAAVSDLASHLYS